MLYSILFSKSFVFQRSTTTLLLYILYPPSLFILYFKLFFSINVFIISSVSLKTTKSKSFGGVCNSMSLRAPPIRKIGAILEISIASGKFSIMYFLTFSL